MASEALESTKPPTQSLLSAAAAGLFTVALAGACSSASENPDTDDRALGGAPGSGGSLSSSDGGDVYYRVLETGATEDDLVELCDEREGWLYRTAFCAGSGHCKGLFLLEGTLSEYSCKGMNSCGGIGCIDMPEGQDRSGKEVYEKGGCAHCHGKWTEDYSEVDLGYFQVIHPNTMTAEDKLREFEESSVKRLVSILIFGTQGVYANGDAFSNMPSYRDRYSREELRRAAEYIKGLKLLTSSYEVPGGSAGSSGGLDP